MRSYKDKLPPEIRPDKNQPKSKQEEYSHTYFQGLIVELGNLKKYKTFIPNQDRNKLFLSKKLSDITAVSKIYRFGYDHLVRKAQTIDVAWFNERNMPASLFEIEHSTQIHNSLLKFVELQDFQTNFCIVADKAREKEFRSKLSLEAFKPISSRVGFWSYNDVVELHSKTSELIGIEARLRI